MAVDWRRLEARLIEPTEMHCYWPGFLPDLEQKQVDNLNFSKMACAVIERFGMPLLHFSVEAEWAVSSVTGNLTWPRRLLGYLVIDPGGKVIKQYGLPNDSAYQRSVVWRKAYTWAQEAERWWARGFDCALDMNGGVNG